MFYCSIFQQLFKFIPRYIVSTKAYFALDELINREWRTDVGVKAGKDGSVEFRGFRGSYRLSWRCGNGAARSAKSCCAEKEKYHGSLRSARRGPPRSSKLDKSAIL